MNACNRILIDFHETFQEEPEGTVTKSIRLTAALILRNLVTYSNSAKRCGGKNFFYEFTIFNFCLSFRSALRYHEYHLSQIALSSNESNRVVAQVLYEMNEQISPFARP